MNLSGVSGGRFGKLSLIMDAIHFDEDPNSVYFN